MDEATVPSSIEEVEALVLALYEPAAAPSSTSSTQSVLQQLQRSPQGWELAQHLLARPDPKVKFFGALTIIVKLNTESSSLENDDVLQLLEHLISWVMKSIEDNSGTLVSRKLASALATLFIKFPNVWRQCVHHLAYCLSTSRTSLPNELDSDTETLDSVLRRLNAPAIRAVLWFATTIAEDVVRMDMNSHTNSVVFEVITANATNSSVLISEVLSRPHLSDSAWITVAADSIKCLQAWICFSQRVSSRNVQLVGVFRPLFRSVVEALLVDDLFEPAAELASDVLSNYSTFLFEADYELLLSLFESDWADRRFRELAVDGNFDFEQTQFGHLLLAFGDARVQDLLQANDSRSNAFLSRLSGLLSAPGIPAIDDKIFVPTLEFWSTFIETTTDTVSTNAESSSTWAPASMEHIRQVISNAWQKIPFPIPETVGLWDSAEKLSFTEARKDVADLLQASFVLMGLPLVSIFADATIKALVTSSWDQLEAAAFGLGALADCVAGGEGPDTIIDPIFNNSLFYGLHHNSGRNISARTRQTCVSLIEKYADYFERHPAVLPHALNFLFAIIEDPQLAGTAARSIFKLCSSCRSHLGQELNAFLHHYQSLNSRQLLDCLVNEKIMGAMASVVQSFAKKDDGFYALAQLLTVIQRDIKQSFDLLLCPATESHATIGCRKAERCVVAYSVNPAAHLCLKTLRCLGAVAKGLQTPPDGPIDLEATSGFATRKPSPEMAELQTTIMTIIVETSKKFPTSGDVIETVCNVLRAGFSESEPGPFVLPPDNVSVFFLSHGYNSPRIGALVSAACSFISSASLSFSPAYEETLRQMLSWVVSVIQQMPHDDTDTEVAQSGIDFVRRLTSRKPSVLLLSAPADLVEFFFLFTLRMLDGTELLPKVAAADFWVTFISLRIDDNIIQDRFNGTLALIGPLLGQSLIRNIGGNAARSELDKLSEPLKRLINSHPKARSWLEDALTHSSFPSPNVTEMDKKVFLKRIVSLRGGRATNQAVRDFWLASRGSKFAYAL